MTTRHQALGRWGEAIVTRVAACPRCKQTYSLKRLPPNFKCADIICDFCGYLAQVKTASVRDYSKLPKRVLGAAWGPQKARMRAGVYIPLFIVLRSAEGWAAYLLATEFQHPKMFKKRKPLSQNARRAGWQGFTYDLSMIEGFVIRIFDHLTRG